MKIKGIIWLDEIIDKLAVKHNVEQNEVLEILLNHPYSRLVEKGYRSGENLYAALGQTERGRYLTFSLSIRKMDAQLYYRQEV